MLSLATSYRITEEERTFKSEYLISQSIMMACKNLKYDGVAYYSKRVDDELFALCAINLALFIDYDNESSIIKHMKIDDSFNYTLYKQLDNSLKYKNYEMSSIAQFFLARHKEQQTDYTAKFRTMLETKTQPTAAEAEIKRQSAAQPSVEKEILCPKCGSIMVRRKATKGPNAGREFYGCSAYPKCRCIINIK